MLAGLEGMASGLEEMLSSVQPALLHPIDAVKLLEAATCVEQRAGALKTLLAARAAEAGEWRRLGYRSPEEWLAQQSGCGWGQAAGTLNASEKLADLPALDDAVRKGELSAPKLLELAKTATPDNAKKLVESSKTQSYRQVKRACQTERARARSEDQDEARNRRIHDERSLRTWTDAEGWHCEIRNTPAAGARIEAAVFAAADAIFKEAYAAGRRESMAAYRVDALERLVCGGGAGVDTTVVIRVDESRLRDAGGTCETTTTGPVPASEAIGAILAGAFVKVVAHDGTEVTRVAHHGRHVPAEVRTAILERDGHRCVRPDCGSSTNLELHHYRMDHARGGPVAVWNLCCLCRHCHHLVTHGGHRLEGGPGNWTWIPPPQ